MAAKIHKITPDPEAPTLEDMIERFLERRRSNLSSQTIALYRESLNGDNGLRFHMYLTTGDAFVTVDAVSSEHVYDWLQANWADASAATYNRHRTAALSFFTWCVKQGITSSNPAALTEARSQKATTLQAKKERPLTERDVERLLSYEGVLSRDRSLWSLMLGTWCRAEEALSINIEDLNIPDHSVYVIGKGGGSERLVWGSDFARRLPHLLKTNRVPSRERTRGPLFVASKLPSNHSTPKSDLDEHGHARLSYRQASAIASLAGRALGFDAPLTLHRLRHTGITRAAERGWTTAELMAKSRHTSLKSLGVYVAPGDNTVDQITADLDRNARRGKRRR